MKEKTNRCGHAKMKSRYIGRLFLFRMNDMRAGPAEHVSQSCIVRLAKYFKGWPHKKMLI